MARVDLLTVIEKVRPGGQIDITCEGFTTKKLKSRRSSLENCLKKAGLRYKEYELDYFVSYDEKLLDRLFSRKIKTGKFLGYPGCCMKHFEKSCKNYSKNKQTNPPSIEYYTKCKQALKKGLYDDVFDFVIHIPCSPYCDETIAFAKKIRKALYSNDPEAYSYLRKRNRMLTIQDYRYHSVKNKK